MQTLINDLLDYSRVSTRGKKFEPTDCDAVLQNVLVNLAAAVRESKAQITSDSLPTVAVDPTQFGQLLQNLLGNAIKFRNPSPPSIHVGVARERGGWLFSVRDNGIGIEAEYFERI